MASKQVTDRQKSGLAVAASAETHAAEVELAFAERFAPHLRPGEVMPSIAMLLILTSRELLARTEVMVAADEAHERELGDDAGPRESRDAETEKLSGRTVEMREIVIGLYGRPTAERIGFVERTPRDPVVLERFVRRIVGELREHGLPASRVPGAALDPVQIAAELEQRCDALAASLRDVAREEREAQATLGRRNDAMGAYDRGFSEGAALQVAVLRHAGRDDLAERVRPSVRSPGRTEAPEPEAPVTP